MSIESFFTALSPQAGQTSPGGKAALSGSAMQLQGSGVFDFFLAQIQGAKNQDGQTGTTGTEDKPDQALQSNSPLLAKRAGLDIAQILTQEVEPDVSSKKAALVEILALNQQAIEMTRNQIPATNEYSGETEFLSAPEKLAALEEKLDSLPLETGDMQALKAFFAELKTIFEQGNLAPRQAADLEKKIHQIAENLQAKTGHTIEVPEQMDNEALAEVLAAILPLINPTQKTGTAPKAQPNAGPALILAENDLALNKQDNALAARLNSLVVGGEGPAEGPAEGPLDGARLEEPFGEILEKISNEKPPANTNVKTIKAPATMLDSGAIPAELMSAFDPLSSPQIWISDFTESAPVYGVTDLQSLTNLTTQTQHAGRAHPASQLVAATIQKSINGGQSKNITLHLNPPELGKVEVRMEFGKDKILKTTILSEKPETFMMLQRDGHVLERLFQESGLSADSALSFELAQEGYEFNQNGGHDPRAGTGHGGEENAAEDRALLETTMTWHIDPGTGHMRYNLLA